MKKPQEIPWKRKVRLTKDYKVIDPFQLQPGDEFHTGEDGKGEFVHKGRRLPPSIISKNSIGIINEGPYSSGLYDYVVECPVQFGLNNPRIPQTIGIPWELLEFAN